MQEEEIRLQVAYLILGGCGRNNLVEITTEIYLRLCGDAFEKVKTKGPHGSSGGWFICCLLFF